MKKTMMILGMVLLLTMSMVMASNGEEKQLRLKVDNDMVKVQNQTQAGELEQVRVQQMIQTTTKLKDRLNLQCEEKCYFNVEEEDENNVTEVEQVTEGKFLGFNVKAKNKFFVDADGNIVKQRKNMMQIFYNWGLAKKFGAEA